MNRNDNSLFAGSLEQAQSKSESYLTLDEILCRLLFCRPFRERFLVGDWKALEVAPGDYRYLASIDTRELVKMCRQIVRKVMCGSDPSSGGLLRSFSQTFDLLSERAFEPIQIVERFLASGAFRDSCDLAFAGPGISIEEAFFMFASADAELLAALGEYRPWLQHEFLTALFSLLVVNRQPDFEVRTPLVRDNGVCTYAVVIYPEGFIHSVRPGYRPATDRVNRHFLYAAPAGSLVRGPVCAAAQSILAFGTVSAALGAEVSHCLPVPDLEALMHRFVELGLISRE